MQASPSDIRYSRNLGLITAITAGLGISLALSVFVLPLGVLQLAEGDAPEAFLLAALLLLPIAMALVERAGLVNGSTNFFQLIRAQGFVPLTFFIGWLRLGGYLTIAALLLGVLSLRLKVIFGLLFSIPVSINIVVTVVLVLAFLNELLGSENRWRGRVVLMSAALVTTLITLYWALVGTDPRIEPLLDADDLGHSLSSVAVVAAALWAIDQMMDLQGQFEKHSKTLFAATFGVISISTAIAYLVCALVVARPELRDGNILAELTLDEARFELLSLAVSVMLCSTGISLSLSAAVRQFSEMWQAGFFPFKSVAEFGSSLKERLITLSVICLSVAALKFLVTEKTLTDIAATSLLLSAAVILFLHSRVKEKDLPAERATRLPLHPLFPSASVALCLFLSVLLPESGALNGGGWLALGALYFLIYGRKGRIAAIRDEVVLGDSIGKLSSSAYRVLVAVTNDEGVDSLGRIASSIAKTHENGEVLLLRVVPVIEQVSPRVIKWNSRKAHDRLKKAAAEIERGGVNARAVVRIAQSVSAGILSTAAEYNSKFIILGQGLDFSGSFDPDEALAIDKVFGSTSRSVMIVRGSIPTGPLRVAVTAGSGPNAASSLDVAAALAGESGSLKVFRVSANEGGVASEKDLLAACVKKSGLSDSFEERIVVADRIVEGVLRETTDDDVLVMGASVDGLLGSTYLGGMPVEVAVERKKPSVVVKRAEPAKIFWYRRFWELASQPLPTLNAAERVDVYRQLYRSARANIDFYVLMFLASLIATMGLLLNSSAVIVGAMLVAPLMSPILSIAGGVVHGHVALIRRGAGSTLRGIGVAVGVGTVMALILPSKSPTTEILARTAPNLLDLVVAIAAGAAGAYGIARKSVAASLPGVAIAVALVPPLCVVGYGLGSSRFGVAGGALLLFATNLCSIVLVGALMFMLLGLRPSKQERESQVRRAITVAVGSIVLLVVPLAFATMETIVKGRIESRIQRLFEGYLSEDYHLRDLSIRFDGREYVVNAIVHMYSDGDVTLLEKARHYLSEKTAVPVRIRATVLRAQRFDTRGLTAAGAEPRGIITNRTIDE